MNASRKTQQLLSRVIILVVASSVLLTSRCTEARMPLTSFLFQLSEIPKVETPSKDSWSCWGGNSHRNNVQNAKNIPVSWDVKSGENIVWKADIGSQTNNSPMIHGGKVFIGTNDGAGYLERFPAKDDLACLLCFNEKNGDFLWQYSSPRLATGRVNDWPMFGMASYPCAEGNRVWLVTNRCEVICLDIEGFRDGENDGPFKDEELSGDKELDALEADVIWKYDMISELDVFPHNISVCSIAMVGDTLLLNTGNGVDQTHINLPRPDAPSFIALNRNNGKLTWRDSSPGENIVHGQWCSPAFGILDGIPQAIFAGGDGWIYSFDFRDILNGDSSLCWKFDCNPKQSRWELGGRGLRNNVISTPVIHENRVYVAVGQDAEHGDGEGGLYCIDPTKSGDISEELVFNKTDPLEPIAPKRNQACVPLEGDFVKKNPNSGVVWEFTSRDLNTNGRIDQVEIMHRTGCTPAISNGLLVIADGAGFIRCLDAKTGKVHWVHDAFSHSYGSTLIVDDKVFIGTEDGVVLVFRLDAKKQLIADNVFSSTIYGTAICANNKLYIADKSKLYVIASEKGE